MAKFDATSIQTVDEPIVLVGYYDGEGDACPYGDPVLYIAAYISKHGTSAVPCYIAVDASKDDEPVEYCDISADMLARAVDIANGNPSAFADILCEV